MVEFASVSKPRKLRGYFLLVVAMTGLTLASCGGGSGSTANSVAANFGRVFQRQVLAVGTLDDLLAPQAIDR